MGGMENRDKTMIRTVLIDDEPWTHIYLTQLIDWEKQGFSVIGTFQKSPEAFDFVMKNLPDVIFIDISMPGLGGIDFIRQMKEAGVMPHVIILSGFAEFEYAQEALRLGALDYCLKPISEEKLLSLLSQIRQIGKPAHKREARKIHYKLQAMLDYIDGHYGERLVIESLAERFEISPTYCSKLFGKELDTTFTAYLLEARMKAAMDMLKDTPLAIKDIVERCGYSDYAHFHKVFKRYTGITAAQYRQRNQ